MENSDLSNPLTITIDGPVASGKTVVGKRLAKSLGFHFMDTGVMYRAVTWVALRRNLSLEDTCSVGELAQSLTLELQTCDKQERILINGTDITNHLRNPDVEHGVSTVSKIPQVRRYLVEHQRLMTSKNAFVVVGRDIGTVVLPDAKIKIYLEASIRTRAQRRHTELLRQGSKLEYGQLESDIQRRDKIDSGRTDSPLRPAEDAIRIKTDNLSIEEIVKQILKLVSDK